MNSPPPPTKAMPVNNIYFALLAQKHIYRSKGLYSKLEFQTWIIPSTVRDEENSRFEFFFLFFFLWAKRGQSSIGMLLYFPAKKLWKESQVFLLQQNAVKNVANKKHSVYLVLVCHPFKPEVKDVSQNLPKKEGQGEIWVLVAVSEALMCLCKCKVYAFMIE